jgi:hypothetical protein
MADGGKGDKARPYGVPLDEFDVKFEAIFGESKLQKRIREEALLKTNESSKDEKDTMAR